MAFVICCSAETSSKHLTGLTQLCKHPYECPIMSSWWALCYTAKRTSVLWQSETTARNLTFGSVSGKVCVRVSSVVMPLSALCGKAAGSLCCSWRHICPCKQCAAQASVLHPDHVCIVMVCMTWEQPTTCLHAVWLCKTVGFTISYCAPAHSQHRSQPPDQSPSLFASPALCLQLPQLSFHLYSKTPISACISSLGRSCAAHDSERSDSLQPLLMSLGKMCLLQIHSGFKHIG